ncbi:hypothetical protein D3C72_1372240 [compost metagenome]
MGGGIAGVGANRLLQRLGSLALLPIGGIQHRQIVIRLGHVGIFARQGRENLDCLCILLLLGGDHPAQKAHLHVCRVLLQMAIGLLGSQIRLPLLQQLRYLFGSAGCQCRQAMQRHTTPQQ